MWKVIALLIVTLVFIWAGSSDPESFATKREKAGAIYNWFAANSRPTYTRYKSEMAGSNVVEYEDVLRLMQDRDLTVASIEKIL